MKIVAFVGTILVSMVLILAGTTALILTGRAASGSLLILLGVVPLVAMIYGPVALGSLVAFWDVNRTDRARAFFRRWVLAVVIAQAIGAAAILVDAALGGTAWWVAIVFIAGGIVLTALALVIGRVIRRHEERRTPKPVDEWRPIAPEVVRRKIRKVVVTFAVALVVAVVVFGVIAALDPRSQGPRQWLELLPGVLELPLFATALACILVSISVGRQLRETAGSDLGRMRTFARVVLRGKRDELSPDEERGAARYASAASLFLRFQLAYFLLLYSGLILQQVASFSINRPGTILSVVLLVGLIVLMIVLLPIQLLRMGRARRYAEAHRDLLAG